MATRAQRQSPRPARDRHATALATVAITGMVCVTAGVWLLVGMAWGLVTLGAILLLEATLTARSK